MTIKAGGFKICLELIVRALADRLVEIPYRFDDRELGESKMSMREAAGYSVQLQDLYQVRWLAAVAPEAALPPTDAGGRRARRFRPAR